jgi:hypothetical protein
MTTATMTRPTFSIDTHKLSGPAQRMYDQILGKVRGRVVSGELTAADFMDAQADCLLYLGEVFGKRGMWA